MVDYIMLEPDDIIKDGDEWRVNPYSKWNPLIGWDGYSVKTLQGNGKIPNAQVRRDTWSGVTYSLEEENKKNICVCDIVQLMRSGHDENCMEKK